MSVIYNETFQDNIFSILNRHNYWVMTDSINRIDNYNDPDSITEIKKRLQILPTGGLLMQRLEGDKDPFSDNGVYNTRLELVPTDIKNTPANQSIHIRLDVEFNDPGMASTFTQIGASYTDGSREQPVLTLETVGGVLNVRIRNVGKSGAQTLSRFKLCDYKYVAGKRILFDVFWKGHPSDGFVKVYMDGELKFNRDALPIGSADGDGQSPGRAETMKSTDAVYQFSYGLYATDYTLNYNSIIIHQYLVEGGVEDLKEEEEPIEDVSDLKKALIDFREALNKLFIILIDLIK